MELKVRADQIKHALSKRHTDDFFAAEVKTGPTYTNNELLIFDGLAVKKSWANPCVTGYEVKVSRGDFLQDTKWPGYLAYCNMFSFVCPKDMIKQDELPDEVGLIYYYPITGALRTVRRAKHRMVDIPKELFQYIIFSKLDSDRHPFFSSNRDYFESYLQDKETRRDLGYRVSKKLAKELEELRQFKSRIERGTDNTKEKVDRYDKFTAMLRGFGIYISSWNDDWIEQVRIALSQGTSPQFLNEVQSVVKSAEKLKLLLESEEVKCDS